MRRTQRPLQLRRQPGNEDDRPPSITHLFAIIKTRTSILESRLSRLKLTPTRARMAVAALIVRRFRLECGVARARALLNIIDRLGRESRVLVLVLAIKGKKYLGMQCNRGAPTPSLVASAALTQTSYKFSRIRMVGFLCPSYPTWLQSLGGVNLF